MSLPKNITLTYFGIPGRAEASRIALRTAGIAFNDVRLTFPEWGAIKPTVQPWGQLPMLEVDGDKLYQSNAILIYLGKITGFYPKELKDEAKVLELLCGLEDVLSPFAASNSITDPNEKIKARAALVAPGGKVFGELSKVNNFIGDKKFVVGNSLTVADFALFSLLGLLSSGLFDGIPIALIKEFPNLDVYRKQIASIPEIAAQYADSTEPWAVGYKP